jgi:formamidopyrimidine-DNA glycosylase
MSGRMLVGGRVLGEFHHEVGAAPWAARPRAFDMEGGVRVTFNDARRFG